MPPVLKTERLTLRPLLLSDAVRIRALCSDLAVTRWLANVPHPYPEGEAERFVAKMLGEGCDRWALESGAEPGLIGIVGINRPEEGGQLGYWLGRAWWGQGLMSEAATAAVAHGLGTQNRDRLGSGAFEGNHASLRIQEKLGFRVTGTRQMHCRALGRELRHIDTELTRAGWEALR